jgi:N-methylhydantoinase B
VELDLRSRIAANNVAGQGFLALVAQFGVDFVMAAGEKMIADGEALARAKLRRIPDGTWTSRQYGTPTRGSKPFMLVCRATKRDDSLILDFAGTSGQVTDDSNSTLPSSLAHIAVALTNTVFWDVPWNDGKMVPVDVRIPEGTILNCRFPAACRRAPQVGQTLCLAVMDCLARMLYAAGDHEDVNAGWHGLVFAGGPGFSYSGHNAEGIPVAQGLFDIHGGGYGAAPYRDGVDTAGHPNIPSGGINDVEAIELHYPLLYFSRNHVVDGAGYGKFRGGAGSQRIYMPYDSDDLGLDFKPYLGVPHGGAGLFGGYPFGGGGLRALYPCDPAMVRERLEIGQYPASVEEVVRGDWGEAAAPPAGRPRVRLSLYSLVTDFVQSGGFGDPLERDPERLVADVENSIYSREVVRRQFGLVLDDAFRVQMAETDALRATLRQERLRTARPVREGMPAPPPDAATWPAILRPHAALEIAGRAGQAVWRCVGCQRMLGVASESYKLGSALHVTDLEEIADYPLPGGASFRAKLLQFFCPGCGTLLQVDIYVPGGSGPMILPDVEIDLAKLAL